MERIILVLLSTDKFSFPLLRFLVLEGRLYGWKICVGSMFDSSITSLIKREKFSNDITFINITDIRQCDHAIRKSNLVVALTPEFLLLPIAESCLAHRKNLISPAELSNKIRQLAKRADESNILLLMECGFSPGLDHITAKKAIDSINIRGGAITSFTTYCGSLISDESITNSWDYKNTEPVSSIINLGKGNNRFLYKGNVYHIPYHRLFDMSMPVKIQGLKNVVSLPEGDSLYLKKIYDLEHANTVIKGKILKKEFEQIWKLIVKLGLTDNQIKIDLQTQKSFKNYLETFLPPLPYCTIEDKLQNLFNATDLEIEKLKELGLFDESWIENDQEINASTILQFLLEKNFAFEPVDRDEVIMQHHIEYTLKGTKHNLLVTLLTKGENNMDSATAKAIGLTTAVAAKSVMLGNISLKGLHIPIKKEIYEPMLEELYHLGIHFQIEKEKVLELNLSSIIQINKQNNF